MKTIKSLLLGIATLSFGMLSPVANAHAYSTFKTIPSTIHGYYIGNHYMAKITSKYLTEGAPQSDMYTYKVSHVNKSGQNYRVHTSYSLGGYTSHYNLKIHRISKYKIKLQGMPTLHKVSKSHYSWYAKHGFTD